MFCSQNFLVSSSSEGSGRTETRAKSDDGDVDGRITRGPDDRKYCRNASSSSFDMYRTSCLGKETHSLSD